MDTSTSIERFFGVYILYSKNERSKGSTYIGFTGNPNRRINQHNLGKEKGGARKTSGRGPWEMVLIIHGFPNQISALRFEWAWQNPDKSTRLRHLPSKKRSETQFQYKFKVLQQMLRSTPWARLPLTIRWLNEEYHLNFDPLIMPPIHMPTCFGKVTVSTKKKDLQNDTTILKECIICNQDILQKDIAMCLHCKSSMHLICLANDDRADLESLIPINVSCDHCGQGLLWGDIIRQHFNCDDQ